MTGNCHVRFGGGRTEKGPQGHLAGRLPYCQQARAVEMPPDALADRPSVMTREWLSVPWEGAGRSEAPLTHRPRHSQRPAAEGAARIHAATGAAFATS